MDPVNGGNNTQKVVYTYDPEDLNSKKKNKKKGKPEGSRKKSRTWLKALLIIFLTIAIVVLAGIGLKMNNVSLSLDSLDFGSFDTSMFFSGNSDDEKAESEGDYIGVLSIHGTIGEDSQTYNQQWLLETIKQMKDDPANKGLILSLNTPGGGVYESDELYLAIQDYKSAHKPVYSYMESMAASGGYYISAPCDKIYANRNCWTGSIGVTIGTIFDVSELLDKVGIKTVTITSGENKAMGNQLEPMTDEQLEIFQSLVDEAYDQFVGIVAEGRHMSDEDVRNIADGRIYTAKQAKELELIDEIGTFDQAATDMMAQYKFQNCSVRQFSYEPPVTWKSILDLISIAGNTQATGEYQELMNLMEKNGKFTIAYLSEVRK